jgi:hypothetical protein
MPLDALQLWRRKTLLTEEDWLDMAKADVDEVGETPNSSDSEANRKMLKLARTKAKMKLGFLLSTALAGYCEAHEHDLPTDVTSLLPYFKDRDAHLGGSAAGVAESMLRRYDILQKGRFDDVPGERTIILAERAPADNGLDTRLVLGKYWLKTAGNSDPEYWPQ